MDSVSYGTIYIKLKDDVDEVTSNQIVKDINDAQEAWWGIIYNINEEE